MRILSRASNFSFISPTLKRSTLPIPTSIEFLRVEASPMMAHIKLQETSVHTHITLVRQKSERRKIDIAWRRFLCNSISLRPKPSRAKCEVFITSFEGVFCERWFSWVIKSGTLVAHILRAIIDDVVLEFAWVGTGWTRWHIDYIVKGSKWVSSNNEKQLSQTTAEGYWAEDENDGESSHLIWSNYLQSN